MPHFSLEIADRVKETSTTSGTGTLSLAGAKTGFQAFSVLGDGARTQYGITNGAGDFEVGIGTYTSSGTTLSRDFIFDSSNSGNKVNFSAAEKDVFVTLPADRAGVISAIDISSASGTVAGTQSIIPETTGGFTLGAVFLGNSTTTISGTVVVFDNASYMIADTAYTNEISPYIVDGTISSTSVAIGGFNVAGNVTISGNVEVIDATSHAVLNLGNTVTLNA
tara:strand:- start:2041 stop:2706 length:666 start_codon:yes stop_codon:yes gene_type:complete